MLQFFWVARAVADDDDDDDYDGLPGRTEEQIDALIFNFDEVVETIGLYAALSSILVIILLLSLALRLKTWAAYIGLTILSMIWFALLEQVLLGLYWLGFALPYSALVVLGFVLASLHGVLAGVSMDPARSFGRLGPVMFLYAAAIWGILALSWPISETTVPAEFVAVAVVALVGHLLAIPSFSSAHSPTVQVSRNGQVFAAIAVILVLSFVLFGEIAEELDIVFLGRLVLIAVVGFFCVFLVRHATSLLRDRDVRIRKEKRLRQRSATLNKVRPCWRAKRNTPAHEKPHGATPCGSPRRRTISASRSCRYDRPWRRSPKISQRMLEPT